jgi:hypothetical protein
MAARCFPESPTFESVAERVVWTALRDQLPDHASLFANLALTDRKGALEADLVVLWPDVGVAVVEVKGGTVTRGDDGRWLQTGIDGHVKTIDPAHQAKRARFAFRHYVAGHTSLTDLRMVHLVAFPYTRVADDFAAPDCPRWMVIDRADVEAAADRVESALRHADGPTAPGQLHVDAVVDTLTQRPGPQRDLVGTLAEREDAVDVLTQQQVGILRSLQHHPRVVIAGARVPASPFSPSSRLDVWLGPACGSASSATATAWPRSCSAGSRHCRTPTARPTSGRSTTSA